MKKMPRKFQAGGATPAPSPDRVPPAEAAKMKAEKEQREREKKEQEAGQRRPNLGKLFKKGGAVRKFNGEDGSAVENEIPQSREGRGSSQFPQKLSDRVTQQQPELREGREGKDIYYTGRFKGEDGDETYRRAYAQANRLTTPSGDEETGGKARTGLKEPSVRKAAPKPAFRRPSPRVSVAPSKRAEEAPKTESAPSSESLSQGLGRKFAATEAAFRNMPSGTSPTAYAALKKARDDAESAYTKSVESERTGKSVVKMAKGGGVEAKGKTKGEIVKMATGGSVRGYGISKVTNKTKYV